MIELQSLGVTVFVDIHAFGPQIMYPHGHSPKTNQNDKTCTKILNSTFNGKRDGNTYMGGYIAPDMLGRLLTKRAGTMATGAMMTGTLAARGSAEAQAGADIEKRQLSAVYAVKQSVASLPDNGLL